MKITRVLVAALSMTAVAAAVAAPAQAYDRGGYSYAAGHMIDRSDVPKILGAFKPGLAFNAYAPSGRTFLCSVPQADANAPEVAQYFPGGQATYAGSYSAKGKDAPSIEVTVTQYASAQKAIAAYDALKKNLKKCTGTGSSTYTDPDTGSSTTYSTQLTNGVVPEVTTAGVESVFLSNNSLSATTPGDSKYVNDQYLVFSLFDDVVIGTQYFTNTNVNMTTKQRKAVNQVAFNAETRWLG